MLIFHVIENRQTKTQALDVIEALTFELCIIFLPSDLMWQSAGVFLAILVIETLLTIVAVIILSHLLIFCVFKLSYYKLVCFVIRQIAPSTNCKPSTCKQKPGSQC